MGPLATASAARRRRARRRRAPRARRALVHGTGERADGVGSPGRQGLLPRADAPRADDARDADARSTSARSSARSPRSCPTTAPPRTPPRSWRWAAARSSPRSTATTPAWLGAVLRRGRPHHRPRLRRLASRRRGLRLRRRPPADAPRRPRPRRRRRGARRPARPRALPAARRAPGAPHPRRHARRLTAAVGFQAPGAPPTRARGVRWNDRSPLFSLPPSAETPRPPPPCSRPSTPSCIASPPGSSRGRDRGVGSAPPACCTRPTSTCRGAAARSSPTRRASWATRPG